MSRVADDLDPIFKALSDPTRREILDFLKTGPRLTGEIVEQFPDMTRFGVMKHVDVLRSAGLIVTTTEGRRRLNSLNAIPIRMIYERWLHPFSDSWASNLLRIKHAAENDTPSGSFTPK